MQNDLISRNSLLEKLNGTGVQIMFNVPVEEVLGGEADLDDFAMLVQDAVMAYRTMVITMIEEESNAYDVEKVIEQISAKKLGGRIDAGVVAKEIIRNGGKE